MELTACAPACPAILAKKHAKVKKEGGVAGIVGGGDGAEGEEGEENKVSHVAPAALAPGLAARLGTDEKVCSALSRTRTPSLAHLRKRETSLTMRRSVYGAAAKSTHWTP